MSQHDIDMRFKKAVRVARRNIKILLLPGRKKAFSFVPGIDCTPSRIHDWTSSRERYDHLRKRIAKTLRNQEQLPANVSNVAADMVEGKRPTFKRRRQTDLAYIIGTAVDDASNYVPPYRNEATALKRSACDAVVQAATQLKIKPSNRPLTYDSVAHRYKQYLRAKKAIPRIGRPRM